MILGIVIVIAIIAGGYYVVKDSQHGSNAPAITYTSTVPATQRYTSTIEQTSTISSSNANISSATTTVAPQNKTASNSSYTIRVETSPSIGSYLANASGFTLYYYKKDTPNSGTSACNGGCAAAWPPFYSATINAAPGINASAFGTITRSDGSKQTTYDGWPLYYYADDSAAGQTNGQGVGGVWYAVPSSGNP